MLTIIAGSNGAGKSTLTSYVREEFQQAPVLDPDAIAKSIRDTLSGETTSIEAGKRILRLAEELIKKKQSFTVETTLSGSTYLRMAARAKSVGFDIVAVFIGTASIELNMQRIRARVEQGGHDVPEEDQRRRYPRTLQNMKKLLPQADRVIVLDNSGHDGYVLVAFGEKHSLHWNEEIPEWARALQSQSLALDPQ